MPGGAVYETRPFRLRITRDMCDEVPYVFGPLENHFRIPWADLLTNEQTKISLPIRSFVIYDPWRPAELVRSFRTARLSRLFVYFAKPS